MPIIPLGFAEGDAHLENLARIRLHNMFVTDNRYSPDKLSRLSRPTLTLQKEIENLPVYGFWAQAGSLSDNWLVVTGEELYKVDPNTFTKTLIGNVPGTDYCVFAGTTDRVLIVRNSVAYSTDGTTITTISMPDSRPVSSVATMDGYFILTQENSQRFYWIAPGETNPDALSFASAERTPDALAAVKILSDEVWFLGESGTEVWQTTGSSASPYQRTAGRVYSDGCVAAQAACTASLNGVPCLIWVTEKKAVMLAQGSPVKISTKSVEEALKNAEEFRAWTFRYNMHDFYVLTTNLNTLVFDITKQTWAKWDSYSYPNWRAHLGIQVDEMIYAGDSQCGCIWKLEDGYSDDGEPVIREVSGFMLEAGSGVDCASVNLRMNVGWPPTYTSTPVIEMRFSDDYGFSWSNYIPANMGQKGKYEYDVTWRSLGNYSRPGREFEFRFSEAAKFRIDYATMNEV